MTQRIAFVSSLIALASVLGATVLREPIASAAQPIVSVLVTNDASHPVPVAEQNLDAQGNLKVHEQGTADVNVTNAPTVHLAIPTGAFSFVGDTTTRIGEVEDASVVSGPDPAGTNYAITSVTVANRTHDPSLLVLGAVYGRTSDCRAFDSGARPSDGPQVMVPANATVHLDFPQPFILSAQSGDAACLVASTLLDNRDVVTVVGYRF